MQTYGYARLNSLHVPKNFSIEEQIEMIRNYAETNNLNLVDIVFDKDQTSMSLDMPGISKLIECIQSKKLEVVVIARLDRLTRSVRKMSYFIDEVIKNNVRLISIVDNFDTQKESAKSAIQIIDLVSRWDSKMISDRTKKLIRDKRKVGEYVGHAPYGFVYKEKKLIPYPKELLVIKDVFNKRNIENASYHKIARSLNEKRIPSKRGRKWYAETIKMIYTSSIYADINWESFSPQDTQCINQLKDSLQKIRESA